MRYKPQRYIPDNAVEINHPDGLGIVYHYTDRRNILCAIAYAGKSAKSSWHYSYPYKDPEKAKELRQKKTEEFFANLTGHEELKAKYKRERAEPHDFKVGEIICNSWGYDQTNTDYYEIVKVSTHFVWLRPVASSCVETGFMSGESSAIPGRYTSDEITQHKADARGYVNFTYGSGHRAREKEFCSWYA